MSRFYRSHCPIEIVFLLDLDGVDCSNDPPVTMIIAVVACGQQESVALLCLVVRLYCRLM